MELSREQRERLFDEVAHSVSVDLAAGEAYRHWRGLTLKDPQVRFGGLQRNPMDGSPIPFVTFAEGWVRRFEELFRKWKTGAPPELGAEAYADAHAEARAYPEVAETLAALRDSGQRYKLAVLSDADSGFLHESVGRNGLDFDAVISSEELRAYKPHVSVFRAVCERLGVAPEEALYVGDSPWPDVAGARHAGLRAVWVDRDGAAWPKDIEPPAETVRSLLELLELPVV